MDIAGINKPGRKKSLSKGPVAGEDTGKIGGARELHRLSGETRPGLT